MQLINSCVFALIDKMIIQNIWKRAMFCGDAAAFAGGFFMTVCVLRLMHAWVLFFVRCSVKLQS